MWVEAMKIAVLLNDNSIITCEYKDFSFRVARTRDRAQLKWPGNHSLVHASELINEFIYATIVFKVHDRDREVVLRSIEAFAYLSIISANAFHLYLNILYILYTHTYYTCSDRGMSHALLYCRSQCCNKGARLAPSLCCCTHSLFTDSVERVRK